MSEIMITIPLVNPEITFISHDHSTDFGNFFFLNISDFLELEFHSKFFSTPKTKSEQQCGKIISVISYY